MRLPDSGANDVGGPISLEGSLADSSAIREQDTGCTHDVHAVVEQSSASADNLSGLFGWS